jgi:glucose/arabinose dehydrogenase
MKKSYSLIIACLFIFSGLSSTSQPLINLNPVITGLNTPIDVVNAGDGSHRIFIVQQGGAIRVFNSSFTSLGTFLTVTGISTGGERGLLSLAFHPNYTSNGYFFVFYTNNAGNLEIARYRVSADPNVADAATKTVVLTIPHPGASNHNGGRLLFGTDAMLYLSTGDGGSAGDPNNNAQNSTSLLGKLLRINVNTSLTPPFYTIPAGNPFGNEVWALGLRNPFRWSFDRQTGDIWIGDVGQDNWEEIDFLAAGSPVGANFGWRCYEGNNPFNLSGCGPIGNYIFPVHAYPTQNPSASVISGTVYRGATFPALVGYYLAVDFYSGNFYKIRPVGGGGWEISIQSSVQGGIGGFGETETGELYAASAFTGTVYRVEGSIVTGVGDPQSNKGFRIYPTVISTGFINLYLQQPWKKLELVSMSGAIVKEVSLTGRTGRIDISVNEIPAALYLVKVTGSNKTAVQKIIVQ